MIELFGIISTVIAIGGVILNNRKKRLCFSLWVMSNAMSLVIHFDAGIWSLVVRDAVFLILAVEGWFKWGRKKV